MFSGVPTEFSEHVGGSDGCGLERQAWRQWDSVCGGVHSGQSPVMTAWEEGQGTEEAGKKIDGVGGLKGRAGLVPRV